MTANVKRQETLVSHKLWQLRADDCPEHGRVMTETWYTYVRIYRCECGFTRQVSNNR